MHLDDLPRLTDEEREALDDGYVTIEGVPSEPDPAIKPDPEFWDGGDRITPDINALTAQRAAALVEMRTAGDDIRRFNAASKREAVLAAQIRKLRNAGAAGIAVSLFLTGCGLTPTQQKWAGFAAGVLVVGAIAAHEGDSGKPIGPELSNPSLPCEPQRDGSCR